MIISVINNKGGTGKTSVCVNTAAFLADSGFRVLLIDLDSQASASFHLGVTRDDLQITSADVLFNQASITEAARKTNVKGLSLVTGGIELANSDLLLADVPGREECLTKAIEPAAGLYDFIMCDCAPSLSTISVNALVASDYYIVPVTPQYLALEGLISLFEAVARIKAGMGLEAELLGIVINMYNAASHQTVSQAQIIDLLREHYGDQVFMSGIKRYAKLEEAPAYGCSILEYAPRSPAAGQYRVLTQEILQRCGVKVKKSGRSHHGPARR